MAQTSSQQIYTAVIEAIQERIAAGTWQPGERLPSIARLAQELGVSTGPVREAVRVLASRGLLRIEHGRGMFVTAAPNVPVDLYQHFQHVDTGSALELFEARRLLEPELAALAAERGTEAEHQAISELALAMERAVAAGEDFSEPDLQFHLQIALAAKNSVLASIITSLNGLIVESRRLTLEVPDMTARAVRYHLLIADAIRDRRPLQARLLMLAHVNDAIDALLKMHPERPESHSASLASGNAIILSQRSIEHT